MTYFFVGPPESGKSTQAERLAQAIGGHHVSLGSLLRQKSQTDPELKKKLDSGELLSPETVQGLFAEIHDQYPDKVVFDGAMRKPEQVDMVYNLWSRDSSAVILLDLSDPVVQQRADDRVNADGSRRPDDAPEIVAKRIQTYRDTVGLVLDKLTTYGVPVYRVNGDQPADMIHDQILKLL